MQPDPWNTTCVPGPVFNRLPEMGCLPPTSPISVSTYTAPPWAHTVPSPMPWGAGSPHFAPPPPDPCTSSTATSWELLHNMVHHQQQTPQHLLKRKGGCDDLEGPGPSKLCITEERMAARFQEMHISNQFALPTEAATPITQDESVTNLNQLDCILKECESNSKSLVLAPELKKLVEPEKIFASTFLNKVERPSMALVLWQPQKPGLPEEEKKEEKDSTAFLPSHLTALCSQHLLSNLQAKDAKTTTFDVEMDGDTT